MPEIRVIAGQMNEEIAGKTIADVEVRQPKNLNMQISEFAKTAKGKTVNNVSSKGKWLFLRLYPGYLMLMNVGMGAELPYFTRDQNLPRRYEFKLAFSDETGFTTNFWWFGYVHLIPEKALTRHRLTAQLGISPLDEGLTLGILQETFSWQEGRDKELPTRPEEHNRHWKRAVQDILFKVGLHPNRKISTLSRKEVSNLYDSIRDVSSRSIQLGGLAYERDFYG